jgi:ankyrin repeat protein
MWRTLLCVVVVLSQFGSDAVARKKPRAEEAQRIAEFADKVSRQGNELRLKLKDGKQVTLKDSRPSAGACDCDGNRSVNYEFRDFIDPWFVIHMQYYESSGMLFVNRDTGREEEADGSARFSPDKSRFIASGYPGEAPCYEEIWKLSRSGLTMEWRTECGPSFQWADSKTVEARSYDEVEATLKLDGTTWNCSGASDICDPMQAANSPGGVERGDSETGKSIYVRRFKIRPPAYSYIPEPGDKRPALVAAARSGHVDEVKALLDKGADAKSIDVRGWTVLQRAAEAGQLEVVRLLLKRGADVNAKTSDGWTALIAAASNRHIDVVNVLLQRNADLNAKTSNGRTALMMAVEQDQPKIVNALLNKSADVNAATGEGVTALMLAAEKGRTGLVQLLLEKGINVNAKDEEGRTPLSVAAKRGHFSIAKLLRDRGAKATLPVAAELGDLDEVQRLVNKGADINAKDDEGATALINACAQGHADVARLLLKNGADVNAENRYAWTALIVAAWKGYPEVVKILLDFGADVRPKNDLCRTALESAQEEGHPEIVALLKAHGAQ